MDVKKRKVTQGSWLYYTDFYLNRRRIRQSTGTQDLEAAKDFAARLKVELMDAAKKPIQGVYVWQDAVMRYSQQAQHKPSWESELFHLKWLNVHLRDVELAAIKRDLLERVVATKQAEGVKPSTANRVMEVVRCILNKAHREWEWIDRVPLVPMLKESTKRVRWITRTEADRLVAELPSHMAVMAEFSLQTGLRRHNVTHLEWTQVNLVTKRAWVHPDQAKAEKAIAVPLSDLAVDLIRQQIGKHLTYVFVYEGAPVYQTSTKAWYKSLKAAGIENFRWHDLRHTWASWHVQSGTPLHVLKELGGWATYEMVLRYAHLACDHLAEWVDKKPALVTQLVTVEEKRARQFA